MYYVYILTNQTNRVLYIGVTGDLQRRMDQHKKGLFEGFTKQYRVNKLIYFEQTEQASIAIAREKQLKGWSRKKKLALIASENPYWDDLL